MNAIQQKRLTAILNGITDPALIAKKTADYKKAIFKDSQKDNVCHSEN